MIRCRIKSFSNWLTRGEEKRSSGIFSLMTEREALEQVSSSGKFLMKMDFQKMI